MIGMAKSDSFFIRASTSFNGTTYAQSSVDLGAYVDALGKSVLRIHNISVQWGEPVTEIAVAANQENRNAFQLTTQSQTSMVLATDKSVISTGSIAASAGAAGELLTVTEALDIAPQHWTRGYLVCVEQIYLGVDSSVATSMNMASCQIVMECSVETLSSAAAMALALSQQ